MSISTEQHAATIRKLSTPPMLFPQSGRNAEEERDDLLDSFPDFVPGRRQRIIAADRDIYLYCQAAAAHWENQKHLAANYIRRLLGDAEYGFSGRGLVFVQRRQYPKAGYWVEPASVDALYKVRN